MSEDVSLQQFSELVEAVYAAAFDPLRWLDFGQLLAARTRSVIGGIGVFNATTLQFEQVFGYGVPDGYFDLYRETLPFNPMVPYVALSAPGACLTNSKIVPEAELVQSHFYQKFMKPQNLIDSIGVVCLRAGPRQAVMVANRAVGQPFYGESEARLFEMLYPHVCRALTISNLFELRSVHADALEATLDGLGCGVFLIDEQGSVLHANRAGARLCADGRIVSVHHGRLWPVSKGSRDSLANALARGAVFTMAGPKQDPSIALLPDNGTGSGMIATLLPIDRSPRLAEHMPPVARWAVFVQDPHVAMPMPGEAFARVHGLTPAELRVAMALAPGLPPEDAADMLGIGIATMRTHIRRIYFKTGTNRQIDLVRLMMATTPPAGLALSSGGSKIGEEP